MKMEIGLQISTNFPTIGKNEPQLCGIIHCESVTPSFATEFFRKEGSVAFFLIITNR